jgi:hypothetical protein
MEGAYKNDIKQLTSLSTFAFRFTVGVLPRGITKMNLLGLVFLLHVKMKK